MSQPRIASIVEGDGEVRALPRLFSRLVDELSLPRPDFWPPPIRVKRGKYINDRAEFHRVTELACRNAGLDGGVMVLLDADDECPARLGPELLRRLGEVRRGYRFSVVLAKREFEAWFIASAKSLGYSGATAQMPAPESVRDAKGWVAEHLLNGHYDPVLDQPMLASRFNLQEAQSAPSFEKFCRDLRRIIGAPAAR